MPYEFSPESFTTFTSDILAANGDQATITDHIGEMADVITSAYAEINRIKDEMKTLESERDRLKDTNSRLILRVGAFSDNVVDKGSYSPEKISVRDYMDEYFRTHDE